MDRYRFRAWIATLAAPWICALGCAMAEPRQIESAPCSDTAVDHSDPVTRRDSSPPVRPRSHLIEPATSVILATAEDQADDVPPESAETVVERLEDLETLAITGNPALRRMQAEAAAEWQKSRYVDQLPDPQISTMFYGDSMHFMPDRQLAEIQVMQMIPWLSRLDAEAQRARLEAMAAANMYQAERLRVISAVRASWFKLYYLGKQLEISEADAVQLESLIKTANARIATGASQPGDVLMATLELSSLQEQLLSYRQQTISTIAELNRLLGRDSSLPISPPKTIDAALPEWNHDLLKHIALRSQPEIAAARLRTAATRWGIEVAYLKRRPDFSVGAGWMVMAADPADMSPGAGNDAWTINLSATLPLGRQKYDAMVSEAANQHYAAHASEDEVIARIDALLRDLWEQARASQQTVELYEKSILPQARQTYEADQKSLANNTVTFDRVIRDYRSLLNLELGYHRAKAQLATTLARIRETVGIDLVEPPASATP